MALKEEQGLGSWEIATAKKLVSEYRRRHRILQREEFDDLMQECLAHWIVVRRRIPPEPDPRPPVAYMAQVLRNKLTDLVREMTADKRAGDPGAFSLVRPARAHSWRCKSSRELVTANEAKRNCVRATERGEEA